MSTRTPAAWRHRLPGGRHLPILPVVVYHGRDHWRVAPDFASLVQPPDAWRRYCPDFRYLLSDVSRHSPAPQLGNPRLLARLLVLRAAFGRDLAGDLGAILDQVARLGEGRLRAGEVDLILVYLGATPAGRRPPGVLAAVRAAARTRGDTVVNEWELQKQRWRDEGRAEAVNEWELQKQRWRDEGRAEVVNEWELQKQRWRDEGRAEGRAQGRAQGIRQGIALALELKFGAAGLGLMPVVEQMQDTAQLQAALVAIRDAATLDDLVRLLGQPAG